MTIKILRAITATICISAAAACSSSDDASTAAAVGSPDTASSDTNVAAAGMSANVEGDHAFLRSMSDHHEGLIWMADPARTKATEESTKADAVRLYKAQIKERDEMVKIIQSAFLETYSPKPMPAHLASNNKLQGSNPASYDSTFYAAVIAHHKEGVAMIDAALPKLTRPDVKSLATKMKEAHQSEIAQFQSKAGN